MAMTNAVALLVRPIHTVVLTVALLAITAFQASHVKSSGRSNGNGQLPITLPNASAINTAA
jgi:hypothetical protein